VSQYAGRKICRCGNFLSRRNLLLVGRRRQKAWRGRDGCQQAHNETKKPQTGHFRALLDEQAYAKERDVQITTSV
jgi:hypothetical protein